MDITRKILKKSSPNGLIDVYLIDHDFYFGDSGHAVKGLVLFSENDLASYSIHVRLLARYWNGRAEAGFGKPESEHIEISDEQIWPFENPDCGKNVDDDAEKLLKKIDSNGKGYRQFSVLLPNNAPSSILIDTEEYKMEFPVGITYEIHVCSVSEKGKTKSSSTVRLYTRNVKVLPESISSIVRPSTTATKTFSLPNGSITLLIKLNKDIYQQDDVIIVDVTVRNNSKKTVKSIICEVWQHVMVEKTTTYVDNSVAYLESLDNCPATPGTHVSNTFQVILTTDLKRKRGLALNGSSKDQDVGLSFSTLDDFHVKSINGPDPKIKVSYSLKVTLFCGAIGGDFGLNVPFYLIRSVADNEQNGDLDYSIEDFTKFRRGKSVENIFI